MAAIERSVLPIPTRHEHLAGEVCPWCEQPIPHDKFAEIQQKIEAKERARVAGIERTLRDQFAREKAQAESNAKAAVEEVRKQSALALDQQRKESAAAAEKATREAAAREAAACEQGKKAAEAAMTDRLAAAEQAKTAAESQLQAVKASSEGELSRRLLEQRELLEKDKTAAVHAEQAKTFDERHRLQIKVQELQRQIERKTAAELGEGAELDLFEVLKAAFQGDRIRRVAKGTPGADIIHEVVHNGKLCGKIVYDSKNRNNWQNAYTAKLRADQIAERADHAILSTNTFPGRARQLHRQDNVIVACPARVLALAEVLRGHVVQMHDLRVSNEEREEKTAALYAFVTSERCGQLLDSVETLIAKLEEIDVAEKKAHGSTWEKRGMLLRSVLKTHGDLCFEINRIIGTAE
jgi:hypothetical protein